MDEIAPNSGVCVPKVNLADLTSRAVMLDATAACPWIALVLIDGHVRDSALFEQFSVPPRSRDSRVRRCDKRL